MCISSMVADHYKDMWKNQWVRPADLAPVTRFEFDTLKRQVEEMAVLLKRAQEYDARTNQPECETEEKMDLLRKVAKLVGVDLDKAIGGAA